jgi:hypothetical protein
MFLMMKSECNLPCVACEVSFYYSEVRHHHHDHSYDAVIMAMLLIGIIVKKEHVCNFLFKMTILLFRRRIFI